mgnify:CR=1 FL=1
MDSRWSLSTATTALNTARGYASGCGTQTVGLAAGGGVPPYQQTEEFSGAANQTKTIDVD